MNDPVTPRCEAQVRRAWRWQEEPPEAAFELCGRRAKAVVTIGSRDVPVCLAHGRKLRGLA